MPIDFDIISPFPHNDPPKLCLNMIVKNESKIIRRLIESVVDVIDCYCICDTGSTDNTVEIIETFFAEKGVPGKIPKEPFRDFGYNRSYALKQCETMDADYILLLDADMIFELGRGVSPADFKRGLTHDVYHMFQGTDAFYYKNSRIVKNRRGMSYWGVTHEYVKSPDGSSYSLIEKSRAFINDIGDGGSKADKFERDIRLLKKGLEENPGNDRYTFYLANSYRDHGDKDLAIETYKKRIELGGWFEEVWHSYYNIGKCYKSKGDMVSAIYWWMEGYQFFPKRVENLYEIITHYRQCGKNQLAYMFYTMALKQMLLNPKPDYLFLQSDVYEYKLDYEFSIIGYYCNVDNYDMTRICMKVLGCKLTENGVARNVLSNYKFYSKKLADKQVASPAKLIEAIKDIGKELVASEPDGVYFVPSTPSVVLSGDDLVVNVRYVNYRINDRGGYENRENICTKNVIARFDASTLERKGDDDFMWYDKSVDNLYVGVEDVRLFYSKARKALVYSANRGLGHHKLVVEHGVARTLYEKTSDFAENESGCIRMEGQYDVEKNWVMFEDATGNTKIIYNWHNLVIGDIVEDPVSPPDSDDEGEPQPGKREYVFEKTHNIQTPAMFKYFRGSTNGVLIGDEVWFMCHVVSYEDRRYYYHVFVVLDATTYQPKKYTPMFTFEGEKVEYTLGFIYRKVEDQLFIGYSKMDRSTHYMSVPRASLDWITV
jgi:glycosyltransferase involved in cell wall biosynthesis